MLRCLVCGNEAGQPVEPVESTKGHAYLSPAVYCASGHKPQAMARAGEGGDTPDSLGRRDVLGARHAD